MKVKVTMLTMTNMIVMMREITVNVSQSPYWLYPGIKCIQKIIIIKYQFILYLHLNFLFPCHTGAKLYSQVIQEEQEAAGRHHLDRRKSRENGNLIWLPYIPFVCVCIKGNFSLNHKMDPCEYKNLIHDVREQNIKLQQKLCLLHLLRTESIPPKKMYIYIIEKCQC